MNWKAGQFAKGSKCQITNLQNLQNVLFTKILFNCQVCSSSHWKGKIFVTTFEDFCGFIWWDFIGCFINLQQLDKTKCAEGLKGRESWKPQNPEALAALLSITFHSLSHFLLTPFMWMNNRAVQRPLKMTFGAQTQEQKLVKKKKKKGRKGGQGVGLSPRDRRF